MRHTSQHQRLIPELGIGGIAQDLERNNPLDVRLAALADITRDKLTAASPAERTNLEKKLIRALFGYGRALVENTLAKIADQRIYSANIENALCDLHQKLRDGNAPLLRGLPDAERDFIVIPQFAEKIARTLIAVGAHSQRALTVYGDIVARQEAGEPGCQRLALRCRHMLEG